MMFRVLVTAGLLCVAHGGGLFGFGGADGAKTKKEAGSTAAASASLQKGQETQHTQHQDAQGEDGEQKQQSREQQFQMASKDVDEWVPKQFRNFAYKGLERQREGGQGGQQPEQGSEKGVNGATNLLEVPHQDAHASSKSQSGDSQSGDYQQYMKKYAGGQGGSQSANAVNLLEKPGASTKSESQSFEEVQAAESEEDKLVAANSFLAQYTGMDSPTPLAIAALCGVACACLAFFIKRNGRQVDLSSAVLG